MDYMGNTQGYKSLSSSSALAQQTGSGSSERAPFCFYSLLSLFTGTTQKPWHLQQPWNAFFPSSPAPAGSPLTPATREWAAIWILLMIRDWQLRFKGHSLFVPEEDSGELPRVKSQVDMICGVPDLWIECQEVSGSQGPSQSHGWDR